MQPVPVPQREFDFVEEEAAGAKQTASKRGQDRMRGAARIAALDPGDGIVL